MGLFEGAPVGLSVVGARVGELDGAQVQLAGNPVVLVVVVVIVVMVVVLVVVVEVVIVLVEVVVLDCGAGSVPQSSA